MFRRLFRKKKNSSQDEPEEMSYLIIGLGNIGAEYAHTRHNIGFDILDNIASEMDLKFESDRYVFYAKGRIRGRVVHFIKPTTYMNLSGKAVRHWMKQAKVDQQNILVITDDLNLRLGKLRMRGKGSDGGHNGLRNINETLGRNDYPRLRVGVGDNFSKGRQVEYVLGKWDDKEEVEVAIIKDKASEAIKSFVTQGLARTMTLYNG